MDINFLPPQIDELAVDQVGIVVDDIEAGMDRFCRLLGIQSWNLYRFEPPDLTERTYYGEPSNYAMYLATAVRDGAMVELIEPLAGENLYSDYLREHGEGIHHIGTFLSEDADRVVDRYVESGQPVIQHGCFGEVEFWYVDTRDHLAGVLLEVIENISEAPPPLSVYEPDH